MAWPLTITNQNEQHELAPEQTASILSVLSYSFVEPVVWKAWSVPRLTYEMLPPLPEYDYLTNLKRKSFPVRRMHPRESGHSHAAPS